MVLYIHEPFNVSDPPGRGICNIAFKHWFTYISRENEEAYYRALRNTIELKYDLVAALRSARSLANVLTIQRQYRTFLRHRFQGSRPLIKDPLAFFSAEWLAERFDMHVVVLMRHPAAFVSSVHKLGWQHPFSHFAEQPLLLGGLLRRFSAQIEAYAHCQPSILDQAILLWRMIHHSACEYRRRHAEWVFVRHEDISRDPLAGFRELFETLGLPFTTHVKRKIDEYSGSTNPRDSDASIGSEQAIYRYSQLNLLNWKSRLTAEQIAYIRDRVEDVSHLLYPDAYW